MVFLLPPRENECLGSQLRILWYHPCMVGRKVKVTSRDSRNLGSRLCLCRIGGGRSMVFSMAFLCNKMRIVWKFQTYYIVAFLVFWLERAGIYWNFIFVCTYWCFQVAVCSTYKFVIYERKRKFKKLIILSFLASLSAFLSMPFRMFVL